MLKKEWLDPEVPQAPAAPRHFDMVAGGQVGLWHETIEQRFASPAAAPPLEGVISRVSRLAGPFIMIAALAGLICWLS